MGVSHKFFENLYVPANQSQVPLWRSPRGAMLPPSRRAAVLWTNWKSETIRRPHKLHETVPYAVNNLALNTCLHYGLPVHASL